MQILHRPLNKLAEVGPGAEKRLWQQQYLCSWDVSRSVGDAGMPMHFWLGRGLSIPKRRVCV